MNDEVVTELTSEECWEMLREEEFGRLAYRLVDEVHITPINYAVEGGSLLFRTAEGNKLLAVAMGSEVAFEIDRYGEDSARSVVVRGTSTPTSRGRSTSRRKRSLAAMGADAEVQRRRDRAEGGHRPGLRTVRPWLHLRPHD